MYRVRGRLPLRANAKLKDKTITRKVVASAKLIQIKSDFQ
jgi:hypothetical protein